MPELPTGTATFLLTDIEGSTRLWEQHPAAMQHALARHDALLTGCIEQHGGVVIKSRGEGDSFFAVFARASEAVAAAGALQQLLLAERWPTETPLRVRIALHTGGALLREGDYYGAAVNRCARLRAAAHGGQVLLSQATQALVRHELPPEAALKGLGLHRLRDLQQAEPIYQLLHPDLPADFLALRTLSTHPNNLPQALTSFIGREPEIAAVKDRLAGTRLLTLTGVGGTGKTRLSLQVAAEVIGEYPDGVWLVELAPLADPALVPQAVATVFALREEPGLPLAEALARHLKAKRLLLILDNCEHLLAACAQLAGTILQQCPAVTILASSREGLAIAGESLYRVPSLSLPEHLASNGADLPAALAQSEAVQLFVDRAAAVRPGFALSAGNAPAVAEVCRRLDGIPLALELAAARVRALPVEQLAPQLNDQFRLLTGGSRIALPRQQTLRALIDWSYDLLSDPERLLLRRLSVFAGGWTLAAAETVGAGGGIESEEVFDLLTALVDKSLVDYREREGEARYRLLETVRQYARERLLEARDVEATRDRHRQFYLAWAEAAAPKLRGAEQMTWLEQLELEHDNLRAALEWCQSPENGGEAGLRLAAALSWFWMMRNHFREGRRWLAAALARGNDAPPALRARALAGDAQLAAFGEDLRTAERLAEECLPLARAADERWVVAWVLYFPAWGALERLDFAQATALSEESLAMARAVGDPWLIAQPLAVLGMVARFQRNFEAATLLLTESLSLLRQVGDRWASTISLLNLGAAAIGIASPLDFEQPRSQGDDEQAARYWLEALALSCEMADRRGVVWCFHCLAWAAVGHGRAERAVRLTSAAQALREGSGASVPPGIEALSELTQKKARVALEPEVYAAAWAEGQAMELHQAVECALEEPAHAWSSLMDSDLSYTDE